MSENNLSDPIVIDDTPVPDVIETTAVEEPVVLEEPVTEDKKEEEEEKETKVTQKVKLRVPMFVASKIDPEQEVVDLPTDFDEVSIRALNKTPNVSLTDSPEAKRWAEIIKSGLALTSYAGAYIRTLNDQEAEFDQAVDFNGKALAGGHPQLKSTENEIMKGERGILRFMAHQGMGNIYQAPLWHSGFWITFKAPSEGAMLELHRQMVADKVNFGRETYGLVFSNSISYTIDRLLTFALDHVYDTTLNPEEIKDVDLKTLISCHDIPTVIHGLLCAIYSRGFQYRRACVADPEKCNHVEEERLSLPKITVTNKRGLSAWQVTHMSERRANNKGLASIKRYKEELLKCQNRTVELNKVGDKVTSITLRIPSAAEYVDSGHRWIGDIVNMVNRSMGSDATDKERNDYITKQGQATAMRTFIHWVDSVDFGTNKIEDRETLEGIFNLLSSDDISRNNFSNEVIKYIDDTTITVIGIPVFDCPACGKTQESEAKNKEFTNIIPIDIYQVFFALLVQRLSKIARR